MKLSEHFTLEELTYTDHRQFDNTPNATEIANLTRLASFLELVRSELCNRAIIVNSAYRSKQVNDAVGSKDTSQHRIGCAADIRIPGMTPDEVVQAIIKARIPYDQLIREFNSWTHISIPDVPNRPPRKQVLIIDKDGTRPYK